MRLIDADEIRIKPEYMHDICGSVMIRVEDVVRIITEMPTIDPQPQWIPVSERPPERDHPVLVSLNNFEPRVAIDEWVGEDMFWAFGRGVKAWMSLPEPYEKRE